MTPTQNYNDSLTQMMYTHIHAHIHTCIHTNTHLCAKTKYCSPVVLYLKKFLSSRLPGVQNHLLLCRVPFIFKTTVKAAAPTIALVSCYSSASNTFKAYHTALWAPTLPVLFLVPPCLSDVLPPPDESTFSSHPRLCSPPFTPERQLMPPSLPVSKWHS